MVCSKFCSKFVPKICKVVPSLFQAKSLIIKNVPMFQVFCKYIYFWDFSQTKFGFRNVIKKRNANIYPLKKTWNIGTSLFFKHTTTTNKYNIIYIKQRLTQFHLAETQAHFVLVCKVKSWNIVGTFGTSYNSMT